MKSLGLNISHFIIIITIVYLIGEIDCHARLIMPVARSSAWRQNPVLFPTFYNDNQMSCGGFRRLWKDNVGRCGICGDDITMRQFEKGGKHYRGIIVKSYKKNELIEAVVDVTENHKGYFEFRLCRIDNIQGDATQECLDKNLLINKDGKTKTYIPKDFRGRFSTFLHVPTHFKCDHCVFQWKYNAGNSWNRDFKTGKGCIGCGPQEQFYGCSDISIDSDKKYITFTTSTTLITRKKYIPYITKVNFTPVNKLKTSIRQPYFTLKPKYPYKTFKIQYYSKFQNKISF